MPKPVGESIHLEPQLTCRQDRYFVCWQSSCVGLHPLPLSQSDLYHFATALSSPRSLQFRHLRDSRFRRRSLNTGPIRRLRHFSDTILRLSVKLTSRAQELCESRGGRPGLPSLLNLNLRFLGTYSNTSTIKIEREIKINFVLNAC